MKFSARNTGRLAGYVDRIRQFATRTGGNVAMIFGIAVIPMILAGGAAVDYSRAFHVQQRLSMALDATALAVGASTKTNFNELNTLAQNYFNANYPAAELGVPGTLQLSIADGTVSLSATAELETVIMYLAGIQTMDVQSSVEVTKEQSALEVALVLDNTGSMNYSGKIGALKQASTDLVDILTGGEENPPLLKFALVPF